jgi:hypothetical protein
MKPTWSRFLAEYPDYTTQPSSEAVKKRIGGNVDAAYILNTCTVRLSRGLNYAGVEVPASHPGMITVKGADKKSYALRVAEMRTWLPKVLGKPDFDETKLAGAAFNKGALAAMNGIIAFDIHFADATGHLDSWNGRSFSNELKAGDYWTRATRITVWKLM